MQITDFFKKFSLIDNDFIDDFYTFYDENKNEYDFTINIEKLALWLDKNKDKLKIMLLNNYIEDRDYIINIDKKYSKKYGGKPKENILLTYETAKKLSMMAKGRQAEKVRNFYVELEKLLIKYKENIISDLQKQLDIKINNKKIIDEYGEDAVIYFIKEDPSDDFGKLGRADELAKRMPQYKVGHLFELPIVFVYKSTKENIRGIEDCIKKNMKKYQYKKNTEIFKLDDKFIKKTIKYCEDAEATFIKVNNNLIKEKDKNWVIIVDIENIHDVDKLKKNYDDIKNIKKNKSITGKRQSKNKSRSKSKNKSRSKSRKTLRNKSRNTSLNKSRSTLRNKSINRSRSKLKNKSKNKSKSKSISKLRNKVRNTLRNTSRNPSRNRSKSKSIKNS